MSWGDAAVSGSSADCQRHVRRSSHAHLRLDRCARRERQRCNLRRQRPAGVAARADHHRCHLLRVSPDPVPHPQRHRPGGRQRPTRDRLRAPAGRLHRAVGAVAGAPQRDRHRLPQPLLRRRPLPAHGRLRAVGAGAPPRVVPQHSHLDDRRDDQRPGDPRRLPAGAAADDARIHRHAARSTARTSIPRTPISRSPTSSRRCRRCTSVGRRSSPSASSASSARVGAGSLSSTRS